MSTTVYTRHASALGELLLIGERRAGSTVLTGCYLPDHRRGPSPDPAWVADAAALAAVVRGGTAFQRRTWEALRAIPAGSTLTYGELASRVGHPGAARAVGAAVARNPISIVVPCHRVVGAGGSLTGYAGGLAAKRRLLAIEGAAAAAGR
jgi:methylated-DNA-[protein]-cysteine S-methyltransferase